VKEKGRKGNRNAKLRRVALCIELESQVENCKKMKRGDKTYLALYRIRKYHSKIWDAAEKRGQVQIYHRLKKGDKNAPVQGNQCLEGQPVSGPEGDMRFTYACVQEMTENYVKVWVSDQQIWEWASEKARVEKGRR
jgi:hypothetical protein